MGGVSGSLGADVGEVGADVLPEVDAVGMASRTAAPPSPSSELPALEPAPVLVGAEGGPALPVESHAKVKPSASRAIKGVTEG